MLINEMPDDCLLAVFDYLNNLGDLINCYKVCVKWSYLIAKRTKKVKSLTYQRSDSCDVVSYGGLCSNDYIWLSKLFTNLIIADSVSELLHYKEEDFMELVRKLESLKGLINFFGKPIEKYCDELEMLSVYDFNSNNLRNGSSLKQLNVRNYTLEALKRDAHYLPNLERLKIQINAQDNRYDGPALDKLKILELFFLTYSSEHFFYGFQLMDLCPNLQSAHITMNSHNWFFDETLKHNSLQDLVIQFYGFYDENDNWNNLKRLLIKYPNLKHLALRGHCIITDEHIEQLVHLLPNLALLVVREYDGVTQRAADYVKDYCKRYGRSIKFYFNKNYHEISADWPQLSTERENISRGFDFMKNCFRKDFGYLPHFLIPINY